MSRKKKEKAQDEITGDLSNAEKKPGKKSGKRGKSKEPVTEQAQEPETQDPGKNGASDKSDARKALFITALQESMGIISMAAENAGVARSTVYEWMKNDPDFKAQVEDVNDIALDYVESKLFENIENNDTSCIQYYLSRKGKKRGYVEKAELDINDERGKIKRVTINVLQQAHNELNNTHDESDSELSAG
jgi:hypothetical protein